jgi:hypothetical protein
MCDADHVPTSDAAAAFDGLRQEVKLLRMAVSAWVDQQPAPPDYTETLGKIAEDLSRTGRKVAWVAQRPALAMTPEEMAQAIKTAGDGARTLDRKLITEGVNGLQRATNELSGWTLQARTAELQEQRLLQVAAIAGASGLALGLLLPLAISGNRPPSRPPHEHASFALHSTQPDRNFATATTLVPSVRRDVSHLKISLQSNSLLANARTL